VQGTRPESQSCSQQPLPAAQHHRRCRDCRRRVQVGCSRCVAVALARLASGRGPVSCSCSGTAAGARVLLTATISRQYQDDTGTAGTHYLGLSRHSWDSLSGTQQAQLGLSRHSWDSLSGTQQAQLGLSSRPAATPLSCAASGRWNLLYSDAESARSCQLAVAQQQQDARHRAQLLMLCCRPQMRCF
jgi:hypothetical protein